MKTITTSKGEFVVMDMPTNANPIVRCGRCYKPDDDDDECWSAKDCSRGSSYNDIITIDKNKSWAVEGNSVRLPTGNWLLTLKLSEATEDDAKLIVTTHESESINTHLIKLHFILKSKGIDVNSGNWYLFKKI